MADVTYPVAGGAQKRLVDEGDGTHAEGVAIVGASGDINLTGDVVVDTLGALDDSKETDPDALTATIPALLRGILAELQQLTALLQTIAANTDLG